MKRILPILLSAGLLLSGSAATTGEGEDFSMPELGFSAVVDYDPTDGLTDDPIPDTTAAAALLMDAATGTVLWADNARQAREPASVTKIMTLLLVCEAIDAGQLTLEQTVAASAHAAGMGGSQIYLEEGERMTVDELLKSVVVSSGNDAAVALAEAVSGSEAAFVGKMNARAAELGMEDTHFANCTGLPADGHVTSALDIAVMSRELLKHDLIRNYTGIWMDTVRDGRFGLSSTNKLLRSYSGTTGLKTGFTNTAGYCISATAKHDDLELIAVVLGADSSRDRFNTAAALLDYGFAHFKLMHVAPEGELPDVPVFLGEPDSVSLQPVSADVLIRITDEPELTAQVLIPDGLPAPVEEGARVGTLLVQVGQRTAAAVPVCTASGADALDWLGVLERFVKNLTAGTT